MSDKQTAGKGLYFIFWGQILSLLIFIPYLGILAMLAVFGLTMYGFYIAAKVYMGYHKALMMQLIYCIAALLASLFIKEGTLNTLLYYASQILGAVVIWLVCTTTGRLLEGESAELAQRANTIAKVAMICMIVIICCDIIMVIPLLNIVVGVCRMVAEIVYWAMTILYLVFLWQSQKLLRA